MAVFGRESELTAVDALLDAAQTNCALLTVEGEPGIGKTTIWRDGLQRASAAGMQVLVTRSTEAEAALSFAGLGDLFGDVNEDELERLPGPQQDAFRAALLRAPAPPRGIDELAVCAAMLSLLRHLSRDRPVLVAVDDAQWFDTPSSRALSFVVRRLEAEHVGVLTTVRTGSSMPTFDQSADSLRRRTLQLGPLTVAALHETIKQHTGRSLPRPVVVQLAAACAGNPLYALEIVTEVGDRPLEAGRIPVPASLMELVARRVKRLPASTRSALLTAALLSRPTTEDVDGEVLAPAQRAGIVHVEAGQIRFAHPLFGSAIQRQADDAERRRAHRTLADRLTDTEERAHHAALGTDGMDPRVAQTLESAAEAARSRGAPVRAAELLELAIARTPDEDERAREWRRVLAADAWFSAGDLTRAESMLGQALSGPLASRQRVHALELLGQLHSRRSSYPQALALAQQGVEAAADDAGLTADLEMDVAYYSASVGDIPNAVEHAHNALAAAERDGSPGLVADALAVTTVTEFMAGLGIDWNRIRRARQQEDPTRPRAWQMSPEFIHGSLLLYAGEVADAVEVLGTLHARAVERGQESEVPYSCFFLAWAALWKGDFVRARSVADEARQMAALLDDPAAHGMALTTTALVNAHRGAWDEARVQAIEAVQRFQELGWMFGTFWPTWALGLAELGSGNPAAVDAVLGPIATQFTAIPVGDVMVGAFIAPDVEALIELGELDRAESVLRWLEERALTLDRPWARAMAGRGRALLSSRRGDNAGAVTAIDEALVQHARSDMPFERARTLLAKGRIHRRAKEKRLAALAFEEAVRLFDGLGAQPWGDSVRAEMSRLGRKTAKPDDLTATERRVAELAASGLANHEIAERAFLTTKAVEGNLTRVYRKLGIRSRGGIARALQTAGEASSASSGRAIT